MQLHLCILRQFLLVAFVDPVSGRHFMPHGRVELKAAVDHWLRNKSDALGQYGNISKWNTASVTSMSYMFALASTFNGDISEWDTASVTDMSFMFAGASAFNGDISKWNTASVTNMRNMFLSASVFNGNISKWNTASVTDMSHMFRSASAFNGDISKWNTASVADMSHMFAGASAFNGDISEWNTASVTDVSSMFALASAFSGNISKWNTESVTSLFAMFFAASAFTGDISKWNTASVIDMSNMFALASAFNGDISGWNTTSVRDMSWMFAAASAFNGDISKWNTASVTNMSSMFAEASDFNGDMSKWNTASVTDMSSMFVGASAFNGDISKWNTASVTDVSSMFCSGAFNGDISKWNMESVTDMSGMFLEASAFNGDISEWNTASVTTMRRMFGLASAFNGDISKWNTTSVTDMSFMFASASAFNGDISKWNTASVTNMRRMFAGASAFNGGMSRWSTASVTDMSCMFAQAAAFNGDISSWNTSSVMNMTGMFLEAAAFTGIIPVLHNSTILNKMFCCGTPGIRIMHMQNGTVWSSENQTTPTCDTMCRVEFTVTVSPQRAITTTATSEDRTARIFLVMLVCLSLVFCLWCKLRRRWGIAAMPHDEEAIKPLLSSDMDKSDSYMWIDNVQRRQLQVDFHDPMLLLADGRFGKIWRGKLQMEDASLATVAIKQMPHSLQNSCEHERKMLAKVLLHGGACHQNIVKLMATNMDTRWLVYEFCAYRSMLNLLESGVIEDTHESLLQRLGLLQQIACALEWLGQTEVLVVHCDVHPRHILLAGEGGHVTGIKTAKLCDFVLAHPLHEQDMCGVQQGLSHVGTPAYAAPEVFSAERHSACPHSLKSDVWSFALVVYDLLQGAEIDASCLRSSCLRRRPRIDEVSIESMSALRSFQLGMRMDLARHLSQILEESLAADVRQRPEACQVNLALLALMRIIRENMA